MWQLKPIEIQLRKFPVLTADLHICQIRGENNQNNTQKQVEIIEAALSALSPREKRLITLLYFDKLHPIDIQEKMFIARSTFFNIRKEALTTLTRLIIGG
jgi:DNA-directed RNA polymerase specialized sigma subunit